MLTDKNLIKISNQINKIWNIIYNNKFSNWLKEALLFQMDYPLFIYCDESEEYIRSLKKEYQEKSFWKRVFGNKLIDVELSLTPYSTYAKDYSYLNRWKRNKLLKDLNSHAFYIDGQEIYKLFRIRRILEYK